MKPTVPTDAIRERVRPFLPALVKRAAQERRMARDYFVLLPKGEDDTGMIFGRSQVPEILKVARTPAQREKLERAFDEPCEAHQLLVLVTAGDFVAAHFITVPAIAPEPGSPSGETAAEVEILKRYLEQRGFPMVEQILGEGRRLGDFVAIARPPSDPPILLRREDARDGLALASFGDVVKELDVPAGDDELLIVYKIGDVPSWSRLKANYSSDDPS